jgi:oligoribonuclease (3'-5' exoribonuclease)
MQEFFRNIFKPERRWLLITIVVGIGAIVLFNLFPRGSGGSAQQGAPVDQGPSEQLQAAQLQAQTQLAQAQIAGNIQMSAQAGELAARELEAQIALALGEQNADIQAAGIAAELSAIREQTSANIAIAGLQTQTELERIQSAERNQQALISSQEAMFEMQAESQVAQQMLFTELQRAQSEDETLRLMNMLSTQRDIAIYGEAAEIERDRIEAETRQLEARLSARNQDRESSRGFWGNLVGVGASLLGGFLSDYRAKENIEWIGVRDDGVNTYSFNYLGDDFPHAGPMAQEIEAIYPHLVYDDPNTGYKHVHAEGMA